MSCNKYLFLKYFRFYHSLLFLPTPSISLPIPPTLLQWTDHGSPRCAVHYLVSQESKRPSFDSNDLWHLIFCVCVCDSWINSLRNVNHIEIYVSIVYWKALDLYNLSIITLLCFSFVTLRNYVIYPCFRSLRNIRGSIRAKLSQNLTKNTLKNKADYSMPMVRFWL